MEVARACEEISFEYAVTEPSTVSLLVRGGSFMSQARFTLRQLEYFVAVAEAGTLIGAAEMCNISQAGISMAVSELERSLGLQLLTRRRAKGVNVTEAGEALLEYAHEVLNKADELQFSADTVRAEVSGELAVACYTSLSPFVIPPLLFDFQTEYPQVKLEFHESGQPEAEQRLLDGEIELAVLYDWNLGPDLSRVPVRTMEQHAILPEGHPLAQDDSVSIHDLAKEPMVLFDVPPSKENGKAIFDAFGVEPRVAYRTQSFELARCLVARGVGYSLLFQQPLTEMTYEGRSVVSRRLRESIPTTAIVIAYPTGSRLSRRAKAFIEIALGTLTRI